MNKLVSIILLLVVFQVDAQNIKQKIDVDNIERTFITHLPSNYNETNSYNLVLILHGAMGTGNKLSKRSKFSNFSDTENFIAVYPNGMYKSWADARNVSKASKKGVNDIKFISKLITLIKTKYAITKVYIVGISNGGFMVQTLACKIPKKINAFASIISSLPKNLTSKCNREVNIPMLLINGTKDKYVPFKGGKMPKFTKGGHVLSTPKTIEHWKKINQTNKLPKIEKIPNNNKKDGSKVVKHTYYKFDIPQVVLYKIIGGGHGVPGNYTKRNPRIFKLGYVNQDIIAEEEILNFFKLH